jgi:hypothetical protein
MTVVLNTTERDTEAVAGTAVIVMKEDTAVTAEAEEAMAVAFGYGL